MVGGRFQAVTFGVHPTSNALPAAIVGPGRWLGSVGNVWTAVVWEHR